MTWREAPRLTFTVCLALSILSLSGFNSRFNTLMGTDRAEGREWDGDRCASAMPVAVSRKGAKAQSRDLRVGCRYPCVARQGRTKK